MILADKISTSIVDELLKDCKSPKDVESLYSQLLQQMINRSFDAEMDAHLGYEKHERQDAGSSRSNTHNGKSRKTVKGAFSELEIETPRDRDGSFEPQLVKKRQIRLAGMEDKILTLYAKGLTTRDIEQALQHVGRNNRRALRRIQVSFSTKRFRRTPRRKPPWIGAIRGMSV